MSSPRSNFVLALAVALALHALLAVSFALYLNYAPAPDELARLDLTSVDLSFAETVEETAAAVASAPSAPSEPVDEPPPPPVEARPPPRPVDAAISPRQTEEPKLPSPTEPASILPPVVVRHENEVVRQETRDAKSRETKDEKPKPTAAAAPPLQASAPRQAHVDAPARPRCAIKPDYPRESRLRGEKGDVTLEIEVAADGSVCTARIIRSPGYPLLEEAALKAVRVARFTPAKSSGKPVASTVRLTLNFKLK